MTMLIRIGIIAGVIFGLIILALAITSIKNAVSTRKWLRKPLPPGKMVDIGGQKLYATVKGVKGPIVVIETACGMPSSFWWPIQEELSKKARVLTYDRAGYGWSSSPKTPRTTGQLVSELASLLDSLDLKGPYILIGHSLGGLCSTHFAKLYPERVAGMMLLDAVPFGNRRFKEELNPVTYRNMVDKAGMFPVIKNISRLGLLPLMKAAFGYIPEPARSSLLKYYSVPGIFDVVMNEFAHLEESISQVKAAGSFPEIPLLVVNHDTKVHVDYAKQRGVSESEALKVEKLWDETYREYLALSPQSEWIIAENSSHSIDIDRPDLVIGLAEGLIDRLCK